MKGLQSFCAQAPRAPCGERPPWNPEASAGAVRDLSPSGPVLSSGLCVLCDLGPKPPFDEPPGAGAGLPTPAQPGPPSPGLWTGCAAGVLSRPCLSTGDVFHLCVQLCRGEATVCQTQGGRLPPQPLLGLHHPGSPCLHSHLLQGEASHHGLRQRGKWPPVASWRCGEPFPPSPTTAPRRVPRMELCPQGGTVGAEGWEGCW